MTIIRRLVSSITALFIASLVVTPAAIAVPVNPADIPGRDGDGGAIVPPAVVHHAAGTSVWVFVALIAITAAASVLLTLAAQQIARHTHQSGSVQMA